METELLIQDTYSRIRTIDDRLSIILRDDLISSSFDYINLESGINNRVERRNLLNRRTEIEQALSKIGFRHNDRLNAKIQDFFTKIGALEDSLSKSDGVSLELLINKAQIDRLTRMLRTIDDNNSKIDAYYKPIYKFINTVNEYFKDSSKSVVIDKVGRLSIKRPSGDEVSIDALSSGERQILVMFANVIFNKVSTQSNENILIIDEPEVSLHIRWQEKFIDSLLSASDQTQFILATHSPDIIGEYKSNCVKTFTHVG